MFAQLRLVLPVAHIYHMSKGSEFGEEAGLPNTRDLVLDAVGETIVKVVPEGTLSVATDLQSNMIEFYNIFIDVLTILHHKVVKLVLHVSNRVVRSEVHLELQDKLTEVVHPHRTEHGVLHLEEVRFKPLKGHTLEVQLHKCNFGAVHTEGPWAILEVQLTLDEKDPEFVEIHPIKLVGLLDLGARNGVRGQTMTHVSKALDSLSELDQRVLRLLLIVVGFIIIFGIGVREGIIEVWVIIIRRASSWDVWISECITVIGWSVKHLFNRAVTAFGLVLIIIRVSWDQSQRLQDLTILGGLGDYTISGEAGELIDNFSSLSIASKNAEGIVSG